MGIEGIDDLKSGENIEGPIEDDENADPSVPSELLDLHMQLEENNMTLDEFKAEFG